MEDYTAWKFWLDVAQLLGIIGVGAYTWWTNRSKATQKKFKGLEERISVVEFEGSSLKKAFKARPPCLHHAEFDLRLRGVQEGVSNIEGRMVGIGNSLDLIQTHLIAGGKK